MARSQSPQPDKTNRRTSHGAPHRSPRGPESVSHRQIQFDMAAEFLKLDPACGRYCALPSACWKFPCPRRWTTAVRVFTGYRVQHNVSRGPGKAASASIPTSPRRGKSAGCLDDLEDRHRQRPFAEPRAV